MGSIFLNPGFLAVAAALVSVPIIIHLINRMRFKRIRWAAMEFLLKAQKRKRKRLIIEQLLLLFLRCLMVAMVGFLVSRFVSSAFSNMGSKPHLHVVVLDDTLSMREEFEEDAKIKGKRNAFQTAINELLIKDIGQGLKSASPTDELVVVPVSRLVHEVDFQPAYFKNFNDEGKFKEFEDEVKKLEPSNLHVPMGAVIKKLSTLIETRENNRITLHFLTDWRDDDWNPKAKTGFKELAALTNKYADLHINILDAVRPKRDATGIPVSQENVAIVDLRATTRIVSKNMRMEFVMKLANFSSQEKYANVQVFDELTGKERLDVNFRGSMPVKIPANTLDVPVAFDLPPFDERKDLPFKGGHVFISARLTSPGNKYNPLEKDGLPTDNRRYASVEVRENVPVLIVDGRGKVTKEETSQDWFYVHNSFDSVPAASYKTVFGEEIGRGVPMRALERSDELARFSGAYLLNVPALSAEQAAGLEAYVAGGGGVAFFVGPDVSKDLYNKLLYKDGKGVFPVELQDVITAKLPAPKADDDPKAKKSEEESQDLILRERQFPDLERYPIFGKLLRDGMNQRNFENINISKYFRVKRPEMAPAEEKKEDKKEEELKTWDVKELATLPSEEVINFKVTSAVGRVLYGTGEAGAALDESKAPILRVLKSGKLARWKKGIENHRDNVRRVMEASLGKKVYHLARPLNYMLTDPGAKMKVKEKGDKEEREVENPETPDMTELWASSDPDVKALRQQILNLYDEFAYGDPFIIASRYGRGRVVVVLTTSGPRWSGWAAGGSPDNPTAFPVFLEELQKYLASQGSEATYTVGTDLSVSIDQDVFKKRGLPHHKVKRVFMKPAEDKPAEVVFKDDILGVEKEAGVVFSLPAVKEPGISVTELIDDRSKELISSAVHVFNVDALSEGSLDRVPGSGFKQLIEEARLGSTHVVDDVTPSVNPLSVLTESPLFFLIIFLILIAEQALAVHLSFHLGGEGIALPGQAKPGATSRAAA